MLLKKKGDKVVTELKPKMTWYQATRHSFVSRHLSRGASLDEVSAAVGHSSPIVTKRFYDHYVRRLVLAEAACWSDGREENGACSAHTKGCCLWWLTF